MTSYCFVLLAPSLRLQSSLKSSFSIVVPKDSETPGDPCKDIVVALW